MRDAVVAVLRRGRRVLVVERGPAASWSGYWSPLSGRVEEGESQKEAVEREVREEVGLIVRAEAKIWECPTDDGAFRLHWWAVQEVSGELVLEASEVTDTRWVNCDEFLEMRPTFSGDREFFRRILPGLG